MPVCIPREDDMDLTKIPHKLILAQFKANHGFSHSDVASMFLASVDDVVQWAGHGAPDAINLACIACDKAIDRWRQASGAFSDIDRQLYESDIGQLQRSVKAARDHHDKYVLTCESESIIKIALKRAKRKLVWFKARRPFAHISTRGQS